jgi:hypothetical protein
VQWGLIAKAEALRRRIPERNRHEEENRPRFYYQVVDLEI